MKKFDIENLDCYEVSKNGNYPVPLIGVAIDFNSNNIDALNCEGVECVILKKKDGHHFYSVEISCNNEDDFYKFAKKNNLMNMIFIWEFGKIQNLELMK